MNRSLSLYLDIIRPLAAFAVVLSHLSLPSISGTLREFHDLGPLVVDIFFVLSGFVIAYVCAERETNLRSYVVARAARIYSVALPALVMTIILDEAGRNIGPDVYALGYQEHSPGLLLRSISFLGEQWGAHRYPGTNSPYWSLGFEVWYYVAYAAFVFLPWRWLAVAMVLLFIGPKVAAMFPVWLMGVWTYRMCAKRMHAGAGLVLFLAPLFFFVLFLNIEGEHVRAYMPLEGERIISLAWDYAVGLAFSLHLVGFCSISRYVERALERHASMIRWVAGATFSIYLMHLPVMHFLVAVFGAPMPVWMLVLITVAVCFVFAQFFERKKHVWHALVGRGLAMFGL